MFSRVKNCKKDRSTEAHFKGYQTGRGSYLDLKVLIFVKIFEFSCPSLFNIYKTATHPPEKGSCGTHLQMRWGARQRV